MNSIANLFSSSPVQSIGWTLLHTLWQAAIVLLAVTLINRNVRSSSVRYRINLGGLTAILFLSMCTFFYLKFTETHTAVPVISAVSDFQWKPGIIKSLSSPAITDGIQSYMNIMVGCWIVGVILFSFRVIGGSIYVSTLRKNAVLLPDGWNIRVQEMAHQLGINEVVSLAESARIHVPVLLGYIKPIILLPAGMLSGLSAEQVEMVLTHELMHIKRHDYLVNIIQMILEAIFFFNPFVWILSENIRKEREHCCDDAVIHYHPNAFVYATALAQLEEVRIRRMDPALGLAQNKNQLLNRIKRLMENSVKNYSARSRVVPAVLLVIGLICASWLTISRESNTLLPHPDNVMASQDTSIHPKSKKGSYSRTRVVTINENGEPQEVITESDGDLTSFLVSPVEPPDVPGVPDFDFGINVVAPPLPDFIYEYDTLPGKGFYFSIHDFEKFSEEFQTKFSAQFGCTQGLAWYRSLSDTSERNQEKELSDEISAKVLADMAQQEALIQRQLHSEMMASNLEAHAHALTEHNEAMEKMNEDLKRWEKDHAEQMKSLEKNMKRMEENMNKFETELQKELVKDGYLKTGEKINNINWDPKGEIEVNGEKIRDEHKNKYNELHDKFFDEKDLTPAE